VVVHAAEGSVPRADLLVTSRDNALQVGHFCKEAFNFL
jgi:hypothetical protein